MVSPKADVSRTICYKDNEAQVCIIDPTSDSQWDEFVAKQEQSTVFHTANWAQVIQEAYGYIPRYFVLRGNGGQIRAALPLYFIRSRLTGSRLVCLPFSDSCYPLGNEADIELLVNSAKKEVDSGAATYLVLKGWENKSDPVKHGLLKRDYHLLCCIDLKPGMDAVKKGFHHSIKRGVHQAEQRGVTVRITQSEADMESFYRLNVATRKKLGVLPQPKTFFKALYKHMITKDKGFLAIAEWEGKVIAGIVLLTYKDIIYYKYNASDEKYLQKRPNHITTQKSLEYACAKGFKSFDFGRCAPEEESLRSYKSKWGAKETNLPYFYYPAIKGFTSTPESSMGYRVMKCFSLSMPQCVLKAAGSILYKHLA